MRTQKNPRVIKVLLLAVSLVVIAAACGDAAGPDDSAPATTAPETTTTTIVDTTTSPTTTSPTTTSPRPTTTIPEDDPPLGDCTRSLRLRNVDYHLAFFAQCQAEPHAPVFPVYRKVGEAPSLQEKITMLLRGTRDFEAQDGLTSGFDWVEERDQIEVTVAVDAAGVATVDFLIDGERWNPGSRASTSAQYFSFMDPLEATVFSDPAVTALDRSTLCWGESGCTGTLTRETWEGMLFTNYGILCDPEHAADQSWGCLPHDESTYRATVVNVAADDVLNVRSGPGAGYFKIGAVAPNATVEVLENSRHSTDGALWRLVRYGGGEIGWVNSAFLVNSAVLTGDRTAGEQLADAFVEFAVRPTEETFTSLPLEAAVALGLGPEILSTVDAAALRDSAAWKIDMEYFRGATGPFSALDFLKASGDYQVTVGIHDHCASPPMPAPAAYEDLQRISVQPVESSIDSCLMWSTVDLFVTADGKVAAITLDFWEP